ncbi:unnamed protein product [Rotaria sp. Silwood1]|nr:unnamed protein product [Rotaria sp. Silwood1]
MLLLGECLKVILRQHNNNDTSIERDISSIVISIDTKVSSLFNQLLSTNNSLLSIKSNSNQLYFLHKPYRLVYNKKNDSNNNNNSHLIKSNDFEYETKCLNILQTNIDQHIEKQKTILDTISHQFQNVMIV